jgi:DNA sulfur modification protein DndD
MILDAIIIENFGVYGGSQEIDLSPRKNKPVILFGGLNGGGKTTLLDALQLAFYGRKAKVSKRGKLAYNEYLQAAIHSGADPSEGACIGLRFRRILEGQEHHFHLARSWRVGARGVEETVTVMRDGELDPTLAEHWAEYIEGFLPNGIAHLFFFDGEQIKELAEGENAGEMLRTAVHSLLGLDLVERLENDLRVLEKKKRGESGDPVALQHAVMAEEEVERLDAELGRLVNEAAPKRGEAGQLAKKVTAKEDEYRKAGGELFDRRKQLEARHHELEQTVSSEEESLRHLAAGPAPLLMLHSMLATVEKQVGEDIEIQRQKVILAVIQERDQELMAAFKSVPKPLGDTLRKWLNDDQEQRRKTAGRELILGADESVLAEIRHLRANALPKAAAEIERHLKKLEGLRVDLERVEREITRIPSQESIATLQIELDSLSQRHQQVTLELGSLDARREQTLRQLDEAKKRAETAGRRVAELGLDDEDRERILRHSQKARDTLVKFREEVTRCHVSRIEALILESFTQLLRKRGLVSAIQINPVTFELSLTGGDGLPLSFDKLSAGERQLLATSLLWGLARASGRPIPTVIDTPLGRLDSTHRQHLVERYFPVAAHQVILLSTDEEIHEQNLPRLKPAIARSYRLEFDDALRRTTVEPGYFWNAPSIS